MRSLILAGLFSLAASGQGQINCLNPLTTSPGATSFYGIITPGPIGVVQCSPLRLDSSVQVLRTVAGPIITAVSTEPSAAGWLDFIQLAPAIAGVSDLWCLSTPLTTKIRPTMVSFTIATHDDSIPPVVYSFQQFFILRPISATPTDAAQWIPNSQQCQGPAIQFSAGQLQAGDIRSAVQLLANY